MKITALIPARSGSKRVPGKNIKPLLGTPLLLYSTAIALSCPEINAGTFVSSDSNSYSYEKLSEDNGAVFIHRPAELAEDDSTDLDVVQHFMEQVETDLIVYLRPTTPFRSVTVVSRAIHEFVTVLGAIPTPTSLRSIELMSETAFKCFTKLGPLLVGIGGVSVDEAGMPNQDFTPTYKANGYVDIIRTQFVKESGMLWGGRCYGFETPPVIEIDTPHEWDMAEMYLATKQGGRHEIFR